MATPKFLALSAILRRSRPLHHSLYFSSQYHHHSRRRHFLTPSSPPPSPSLSNPTIHHVRHYNFHFPRYFSTNDSVIPSDDDSVLTQSDVISATDFAGIGGGDVTIQESILPVRVLTSLLDGYHNLTGIPWWLVIASSTVALRLGLFPFIVMQLQKLKSIGELFPKLPPPFPPPLSGRSFRHQMKLFRKERKAVGCPSFLWFFASFGLQVPLFLLWIMTIRKMSLDHHPGFDCGGILWFQNLTEFPNGALGPIFPLLISALHYTNVQISFQKSSIGKVSGLLGTLAKYYKTYLEFLTIPMLFVTFNIPQGSLIYWLTNSSLSLVQQLALKHPDIRKKLGLPEKKASVATINQNEIVKPDLIEGDLSRLQGKISVGSLSPKELVALSVKFLANGHQDRAIPLLRLALDKDPEYVRALLIMGQILLKKDLLVEGTEYLEHAVSKLLIAGHPTEVEDVDLLILSSTWAGSAYMRQGKIREGMVHLERLACLEEPADAMSKAHYYDGLLVLSSALSVTGRKAEAVEHLRKAANYDPERYQGFLDQCENDEDDFVGELTGSRRADL